MFVQSRCGGALFWDIFRPNRSCCVWCGFVLVLMLNLGPDSKVS